MWRNSSPERRVRDFSGGGDARPAAVPAGLLGAIEVLVRQLDQALAGHVPAGRPDRDAGADANRDLAGLRLHREFADALPDPLGHPLDFLAVGPLQDDQELVTAVATDRVA